jgi:hypothetical protein
MRSKRLEKEKSKEKSDNLLKTRKDSSKTKLSHDQHKNINRINSGSPDSIIYSGSNSLSPDNKKAISNSKSRDGDKDRLQYSIEHDTQMI